MSESDAEGSPREREAGRRAAPRERSPPRSLLPRRARCALVVLACPALLRLGAAACARYSVMDALCALCAEGVTPDLKVETWPRADDARVSAACWPTEIESQQQADLESLAKALAYLEPGDDGYEAIMAEAALYEASGPQTDLSEVGELIIAAVPKTAAA